MTDFVDPLPSATDHQHDDAQAATQSRRFSALAKKYEVAHDDVGATSADSRRHRKPQKLTAKIVVQLAHRLIIIIFAVGYVCVSFGASYNAMELLRGRNNPWNPPEDEFQPLVAAHLGTATIRESPLVRTLLQNSTTSVDGTIYLADNTVSSFTTCAHVAAGFGSVIDNQFLRSMHSAIVNGASYNITDLGENELIAPVVDCLASGAVGDNASDKFFFLTRRRSDPDQVSILVVYLSNQQVITPKQNADGAGAVATIQLIDDMRLTNLDQHAHIIVSVGYPYVNFRFRKYEFVNISDDGLTSLRLVPPTGSRELTKVIQTGCKEGFYIKKESEQSNVNNYHWAIESDAVNAVSRWRWISKPVLHDSWGWVHGVQFFIGMSLLSNLIILCIATYRNFQAGHWWIGDAFVSISTSQFACAFAVMVSWYMNEFWSLREFVFSTAYNIVGAGDIHVYDWHMRADLMTLYLGACGFIGHVTRERIDPVIAMLCFMLGYDLRHTFLRMLSASVRDEVTAYAVTFYDLNAYPKVTGQDKISPMDFWSVHHLPPTSPIFIFRCTFPIYSTLLFVVVYVALRKSYRHYYPEKIHVQHNTVGTVVSENEQSLIAQKRVLTHFEIATGAKLERRFGVIADFETCIFIAGAKRASPDAIYSTGFVIANGKFLVQTSDFWSIVLMKVLGRRFRNVYVYDVSGSTVKETARLVYPHTLSFANLVNIDVSSLE